MRVGSFVLMRDKRPKGYDAIVYMPRLGGEPSRFEYNRLDRLGYIEHAIQFLNRMRKPDDPEAIDILVTMWPDLKGHIDAYIQELCLKELRDHLPKEQHDEPPTLPF